ncbi:MAG: tyrosine-protein phosphatase [Treponema sp.]|nr:tyrosine-protein phosphatase [Treponema sp.]
MKKLSTVLFAALTIALAVSGALTGCTQKTAAAKSPSVKAQMTAVTEIDKYGDIRLSVTTKDLLDAGFDYADVVSVKFLDKALELPLIPAYRYVAAKGSALVAFKDQLERAAELEIFNGSFADTYNVATKTTNEDKSFYWTANSGVAFPVSVEISLAKKQGYYKDYLVFYLNRTNDRNNYANLSDEQFANFREVTTSGMGAKKLYRASSPVNPEIGRNTYADKAAQNAAVKTFMNLADSKAAAEKYAGYDASYYSQQHVVFLGLGVDFTLPANRDGLAEGLRFFAANDAPYLVHCNEGQDRAGFVSAVLECLMGASLAEVKADYMTTYENYYGVKKGTDQYNAISENIEKNLRTAFGVQNLASINLSNAATAYLKEIGLTDGEIATLKQKLGK